MDMNRVYATLDEMFASGKNAQAEDFLIDMMKEAQAQQDYNALVMLLNEMIGYCRETGQKEKSVGYSSQVIDLMQRMGLEGSVPYATTLLNVANALRAAGRLEEAYRFYMEVFPIYDRHLKPNDFYYASLYNNLSLLLQEMGDYERAIECLQKALVLAESTPGKEFEVYVTHANLASTLCKLAQLAMEEEERFGLVIEKPTDSRTYDIALDAQAHAEEAIEGFIHEQVKDQHMAAALTAYADAAVLLGQYRDALRYLKDAKEMVRATVGETEAYDRIVEKIGHAQRLMEKKTAAEQAGDDADERGDAAESLSQSVLPEDAESWNGRGCSVASDVSVDGGAKDDEHISGLELAEGYYETYGKKMLFDNFGEYLGRIAVGLCGEGSGCLGFDDEVSCDHDFGPGFCMWVTEETYQEIGHKLQKAYDALPKEYRGYKRVDTKEGSGRTGVCVIDSFFARILGTDKLPETTQEWLAIPESALLAATSGMIFTDPEGIFTQMQIYLAGYYPEEPWRKLIAQHMTLFSQYGQYNYARMLKRGDRAAATLMVVKATEHAMHLCYLLNKCYAPHDKWLLRGMEDHEILPMAEDIMTALLNNPDVHKEEEGVDRIYLIEKLAGMFLEEMKRQGLLPQSATDPYLAQYGRLVAFSASTGEGMKAGQSAEAVSGSGALDEKNDERSKKASEALSKLSGDDAYTKEDLVDAIVQMEYQAFDEVENEGGRAECQDNWTTFEIMRKSQYLAWDEEMLRQFIVDFKMSMDAGWNPVTEKYARMMESTAPEKYRAIADKLPPVPAEKKEIIEEIVRVQVSWMEEFSKKYPKVAGNARVIHTSEDTAYSTSYETYLRGEISTYSDDMLILYGRFIAKLAQEGKNLTALIMENTVHMYGYPDLDTAERKMW